MKKILFIVLGLFIIAFALFTLFNKPLPVGKSGPEADSLALEVLNAINADAWKNTCAVSWRFPGDHFYIWDRKRNYISVAWGNKKVLFNSQTKEGIAYIDGQEVELKKQKKLINKAWKYWINDSFWLNAPAKLFDEGTHRKIVDVDGQKALLITYDTGGVTPGDSYLWILNKESLPIEWKLWVSIIPIGGVSFTWEAWETTKTGAKISTLHKSAAFNIEIKDLQVASTAEELNNGEDPFLELLD